MKMLVTILFAVITVTLVAPQGQPAVVLVKETPLDNIGIDSYNFGYELSNGESRREFARLKNAGTENEALAIIGSFSWVVPATNQK